MVKTLLDETELTILSEIGITVRRKISGDPDDYTKVEGSANSFDTDVFKNPLAMSHRFVR